MLTQFSPHPIRFSGALGCCAALLATFAPAWAGEPALGVGDLSQDQFQAPVEDRAGFHAPRERQRPHTFFLNYDGPTLYQSSSYESDSQSNTSWVCSGSFSPFGEGQLKEASVQATRNDWAAYNVNIVTERPQSGDFTMNVVGRPAGNNVGAGCGGGLGVAPVDCGNQNPNDISFTWITANSGHSADTIATTNSQEIAHTLGLAHVNDQGDIMNPYATGGNPSFKDQCTAVTGQLQSQCAQINAMFCPGGGASQNAHETLLYLLGPSTPDNSPPVVSIETPRDEETFTAPADFTVEANATDDVAVEEVRILIDGAEQGSSLTDPPYAWALAGVPAGVYTFEAIAVDTVGNQTTSDPITVTVGADEGPADTHGTDPGDEPDGGDTSDAPDDPGRDSDGGTLPPGGDADPRADGGCGCAFGSTPLSAAVGLLLTPIFARRRRRSDRSERVCNP